jgi:hypothetical protein
MKRSILKKTPEEVLAELARVLTKLKKVKQQEFQNIFKKVVSESDLYKSLPPAEAEDLIEKVGLLALNVAGSVSWTLKENAEQNNIDRAFQYLESIQNSDGTLTTGGQISKLVCDDQMSPTLIRILRNDYRIKKQGLETFHALPDDIDDKSYKDHYMQFCTDSTKEIMGEAIAIARQQLNKDDKQLPTDGKKNKNISWADKISEPDKTVSKRPRFSSNTLS